MTRIHSGALLTRPPGRKYVGALPFAELALPKALPTPRTLRRWMGETKGALTTSLVIPSTAAASAKGPLRFDDAMEEALAKTMEAAEILDARFVVLETKRDVTTGPRDRDLLAAWAARWKETGCTVVWHPTGLWDPELAKPFARKLGILYGFDPLETEAPSEPVIYARLQTIGSRRRFSETDLLETLDALVASGAEDAYLAIASPKSFVEARRLAQLAATEA